MKIALVIDTWFPQIGGGQINAWEISKRIVSKDFQIDIITRNCGKDKLPFQNNLKVVKIGSLQDPNSYISKIKFLYQSFTYVIKNDYDLVHAHAFLPGITAKAISALKKIPSIYTVHGTSLKSGLNSSFKEVIEKVLLTKIKYDKEITVSRDFLRLKNVNKNIVYIANGVDLKKFENVKAKHKNIFPTLLFVGRLHKQKNLEILLESFKTLLLKWPKLKLMIVGNGPLKTKLTNQAKKLNILKSVDFKGEMKGKYQVSK